MFQKHQKPVQFNVRTELLGLLGLFEAFSVSVSPLLSICPLGFCPWTHHRLSVDHGTWLIGRDSEPSVSDDTHPTISCLSAEEWVDTHNCRPIQPTLPLLSASQTHKVAAAATLPSELNTVCLHRCSLCSDLDHILPFERIFCCMENPRLQTAVSWWSWVLSLFSDNLTRLRPDIGSICPVAPVQSDVSNTNRRGSAAALCCALLYLLFVV